MQPPSVTSSIDLSASGKQIGSLRYPRISNNGGWAYDLVPIATIANGDGPTVLISGGNHGNEYEGQIACLRLIDEIEARSGHGAHHRRSGDFTRRGVGQHPALAVWCEFQPIISRTT